MAAGGKVRFLLRVSRVLKRGLTKVQESCTFLCMVPVASLSYSQARQQLASVIQSCVDDSTPVLIKSRHREVVMMSRADWDSWQETIHLLSSPANVRHLEESLQQKQRGETVVMSPEELAAFMDAPDES